MKRTISFITGQGSVNHNSRKFHAKNTDPKRSHWNVEYCNQDTGYVSDNRRIDNLNDRLITQLLRSLQCLLRDFSRQIS